MLAWMLVNYCLPCKTVIALASFGNSQSAARLLNLHFKLNFPPNDVSNVCVFVFVAGLISLYIHWTTVLHLVVQQHNPNCGRSSVLVFVVCLGDVFLESSSSPHPYSNQFAAVWSNSSNSNRNRSIDAFARFLTQTRTVSTIVMICLPACLLLLGAITSQPNAASTLSLSLPLCMIDLIALSPASATFVRARKAKNANEGNIFSLDCFWILVMSWAMRDACLCPYVLCVRLSFWVGH